MTKIAILVGTKGRGSNMIALIDACKSGQIPAEVGLVVSSKGSTPATDYANEQGIAVKVIDPLNPSYSELLLEALIESESSYVCLAGYMRLLPAEVLKSFPNRVLNIHPALLPKFGGKGMYGVRVHEAVLSSGDNESGCTIHFVTEHYDEGEPLLQLKCPILPNDTIETLSNRVLDLENRAYPQALKCLIERNAE